MRSVAGAGSENGTGGLIVREAANVTISTDMKSRSLIGNAIIKFLIKRIYREELALLAEFAARK